MHKAIAIVGPTASGKSDLAVEIALRISGEVVSADSRQVYRGLDIGTGKITEKEKRGVPHYLLDIKEPLERYSAAEFKEDALLAMKEIISHGNVPILCGGTGFFVSAVTEGLIFPAVPPNEALRAELEEKSTEELFEELERLDPERAGEVDAQNPLRLIRAIEIARALGNVPKIKQGRLPYQFLKIGLSLPPDELKERIRARIEKRMEDGMIEESEKLLKEGKLTYERMYELGLEYRYIALFLKGEIESEEILCDILATAIRQYAKRQMTWFKRDPDIRWFHPNQKEEIFELVEDFLETLP